ncbi:MAG: glycosyltransferase [Armatimonas sp.]
MARRRSGNTPSTPENPEPEPQPEASMPSTVPNGMLEQFLVQEQGWKGEALSQEQLAASLRELADRVAPVQQSASGEGTSSNAILIQSASETHVALLDATEAHHRAYAEKWQFDMVCRRGKQQEERPAYWDRIYLLLLALRQGQHEFIAVLDADCVVRAVEWDLRSALPQDFWLGMVAYPAGSGRYLKSTTPYLHSGVMLVRQSPKALEFFEEAWKQGEGLEDENTAILRLLQRDSEQWRDGIAILPESLNATFGTPAARDAAIVAWHGLGAPEERAGAIAAYLGNSAKAGREFAPIWTPANPIPADPAPSISFKKLLGKPLNVFGELPLMALAKEGRAALDIRQVKDNSKADIQVLTVKETELSGSARPLLAYPWSGFLETGLTPAFGLAKEIWAASRFERDTYVHLGIPAEKIQVVSPGVDTGLFTPEGPKLTLPTARQRRLLFVGPLHPDSGADLVLTAYRKAFTRADDVCLVVLPEGDSNPMQDAFNQAEADPNCPEVLLFGDELDEAGRASLYRACHAFVSPSRRPMNTIVPLETMACGVPVIACAGSACDDLADDTSSFRVPARWRREGGAYYQEADVQALMEAMQSATIQPELAGQFGVMARKQVEAQATNSHWRTRMRARLARMVEPPLSEAAPAKLWQEPEDKVAAPVKPTRSRKKIAAPKIALSLCMIARDEEARIGACLESIRPFVDEMILVDTGSTDRTKEIALECGARVFEFPWVDSFAEARNQSLAQARGEWIFWMDADDVIPEECGRQLRELIEKHPQKDAAYQVQVKIPPGEGEWSETVVDHVKLFPNAPDIRFEFRIHEQVLPSLRRRGIQVLPSDLYVVHQHYDRSVGGQQKKRLRDFGLLERDLKEHPEHPFILFNLGMTHLFATKEFEAAAQYLERCLSRSHPQDSIVCKAYALLTTCRVCQRRWREGRAVCEAGLEHYPTDTELLYRAGQIYHELGELEKGRMALEKLVAGADTPGSSTMIRNGVTGFSTFLGMFELAQVCLSMRWQDRTESLLRRIIRDYPEYRPAVELLHHLTGEVFDPGNREWPERPRIAVYYHAYLYGDWEPLVKEQMERFVSSGLHAQADKLVAGVIGSESVVKKFTRLLPQSGAKWEVIGPDAAVDDKAEYKTLRRLHEDGLVGQYEAAWYFHTKGVTINTPQTTAWRKYMEHFLLDKWEEGLKALQDGFDAYGVAWKEPVPAGPWYHFSGNFWATRADYAQCLSPIVYTRRYSCEAWIGMGNPRVSCPSYTKKNMYEEYVLY